MFTVDINEIKETLDKNIHVLMVFDVLTEILTVDDERMSIYHPPMVADLPSYNVYLSLYFNQPSYADSFLKLQFLDIF